MLKILATVAAAAMVVALGTPAFAATETITGKIVDQACYTKDKEHNAGIDHKMPADTAACAVGCAKLGRPLALLTSDGKLYTIKGDLAAEKNAKLVPHVAHTVSVTGDVMTEKGQMSITSDALKMVSR